MCDDSDEIGISYGGRHEDPTVGVGHHDSLEETANYLCSTKGGWKRPQVGFVGYGNVSKGDRVLIAATSLHDKHVLDAVSASLRNKGAKTVDVLLIDWGQDREFQYEDEVRWIIRREHWRDNPRWYDYQEKIVDYAKASGYDFLIHGRGGPIPETSFKFEAIPWTTARMFTDKSTLFPPKLNELINLKTWNMIFKQGRGGKVRLTDPEGTDLEYTLLERYFESERRGFSEVPSLGHLHGHPTPPIILEDNTKGVVSGTTSHLSRPFPSLNLELEGDRVTDVKGGAGYGKAWKDLLEETSDIKYPEFPGKGLFWLWETAIGTNPKIRRQPDVMMLHSGGFEWERIRSGIIHMGFGTRWRGESESWAAEKGIPYGHLHVHLLFPTYEITKGGKTTTVIEDGHMTALDDPEVKDLARKYGDPEEILSEDWKAPIPGISAPGDYLKDYAQNPYDWIKKNGLPTG
ncbi:MAG TPA: hypothetical protein VNE86_01510 [Nitrososphaerales archaeon]|nr:hypothetical protein [Nitrososphaerales archaeon]